MKFEELCANPRPIVVGASQGASCYGPAYEMAMLLDTELKRREIRHKVPITFVTPEPYIGHLGLDGVGDTKRPARERDARPPHQVDHQCQGRQRRFRHLIHIEEVDEDGATRKRPTISISAGAC